MSKFIANTKTVIAIAPLVEDNTIPPRHLSAMGIYRQ
jgi:hypothetical protein